MGYIHKQNIIQPEVVKTDNTAVWMNLENTILSERSQTNVYTFDDSIYVKHPQK